MTTEDKTKGTAARVTILDVAKAAGVSKSSVSRFLDERLPKSDSDTARNVRRIAAELGYVRDMSAASLRRGKTGMIGVIVPRLTDTVMAMLYEALQKAAARKSLFAIVATTDDTPDAMRNAAETLLKRGVDGLVLSTARLDDRFTTDLTERDVPYVLALRTDGHSKSSIGDDELGGYLATRHLLDLGHRRIGLIGGPSYASSAVGRLAGYHKAMTEAGIPTADRLTIEAAFSMESGAVAARQLIDMAPDLTAIFAVNDNTAIGALSELQTIGKRVPEDISVVGYNDIPLTALLPTPLTTVHVPFEQIATEAIELLLDDESAGTAKCAMPTLIPRASTRRI